MPADRFCLDANVLFYSIDPADARRHEIAVDLIERAALEQDCVIPFQALAEFFAAATRKDKIDPAEAARQIEDWQTLFPTVYPRTGILQRALAAVRRHQISFWDSLIWAVAQDAGTTVLLTEDHQDGRELGDVLFRNPFNGEDPFRSRTET